MNEEMPMPRVFKSPEEGSSLLILGGIHGDEVCGPKALERVMRELDSGTLLLSRGTLTIIPVCNPRAYAEDVRFTEDNLNRIFKKWDVADTYEKRLANMLTDEVAKSDYLLDIHSMTANSDPAVFVDYPTEENKSFARVLGARYALLGWTELYAATERETGIVCYDTTRYAHDLGKSGVLIECGQHKDPKAVDVAYAATLNTLRHFSLIEGEAEAKPLTEVRMKELYIRKSATDSFPHDWNHLDAFKKGEVLATTGAGDIVAAFDGVMLLPKKNHPVGTEWFYTGSYE